MSLWHRFNRWRAWRRATRHARWLRKARVVHCAPNPRAIVYSRWRVPR